MRKIPGYSLWIGHVGDLQNIRQLYENDIQMIVELADCERGALLPRDLLQCRFPINDQGENPQTVLELTLQTICLAIEKNMPMLVCCSAGMNRSVCLVSAALSEFNRQPMAEIMAMLAELGPCDVSPKLANELQSYLKSKHLTSE